MHNLKSVSCVAQHLKVCILCCSYLARTQFWTRSQSLLHTHTHTNTHTHAQSPPYAFSLTSHLHTVSILKPLSSCSSLIAKTSWVSILPVWRSYADSGGEDGETFYVKLGDGQQGVMHPVQEREDAHAQCRTLLNVPANRGTRQYDESNNKHH